MKNSKEVIYLSRLSEIMSYSIVTDITLFADQPKKLYFITPEKYHIILSLMDGQTLQASGCLFEVAIDKIYSSFKERLSADQN